MLKKTVLALAALYASSAMAAVNLNTADAAELQSIKGVGGKLAERIVEYRAEHGPFHSVDDLKKVKGVGSGARFESLKEQVTVSPAKAKKPARPAAAKPAVQKP